MNARHLLLSLQLVFLLGTLTLTPIHADTVRATIVVRIELSRQELNVEVDGVHYATWAVSTARPGYRTPVGDCTRATSVWIRMHYSKLYDYTPMPYLIFFLRGYAIHGTTEVRNLGRPVSHGCVRLRPGHAKILFDLVATNGLQNTSISVVR